MTINGQRARFIDQVQPRVEVRNQHRAAAAMRVAHIALELGQHNWIRALTKKGLDRLPIRAQPLQEFETDRDPTLHTEHELAGQDGILLQESKCHCRVAQTLYK